MAILFTNSCLAITSTPKPPGYAIASAHPLATNAGLEILAAGGNAFDAAVAVSAALSVVEPYHSGLGGGGFWLLHERESKKNTFVDGREVAPLSAHPDMYLDKDGNVIKGLSLNGGLAAAIPGEPAALVYISKHFGKLPLSKTLAPAIKLAEEGIPVDHQFNHFIHMGDRLAQLRKYPASADIFLDHNNPYPVGATLYQKDLANTLRLIAQHGHSGFYKGNVAKLLVEGANRAGAKWTLKDLESYQVKISKPLKATYHDMKIITAPLPSAGGVGLITMLNILEPYLLNDMPAVQRIHYIVESMRLAYWQRAELLGDSDVNRVPINQLTSKQNADYLRKFIKKDKATPSVTLPKHAFEKEHLHTTHFSIIDDKGNRVSATLTINYIFGSSVVAKGTGVLLNDQMDDFSLKPNVKNVFGLVNSKSNRIKPGKRPLSSMTPTFLEMDNRLAILGTPGGSRIPTMVLLASLAFSDHFGAIKMVSTMRFNHQYIPDWLVFEPDTFPPDIQKKLKDMGYHLEPRTNYYGDMQAITWDYNLNLLTPASDPRHIGEAIAVTKKGKSGYGFMH